MCGSTLQKVIDPGGFFPSSQKGPPAPAPGPVAPAAPTAQAPVKKTDAPVIAPKRERDRKRAASSSRGKSGLRIDLGGSGGSTGSGLGIPS